MLKSEEFASAELACEQAAKFITERAAEAIAIRGQFLLALSGGSTPRLMLQHLAAQTISWEKVQIFQVDERAVPSEHADSNYRQLEECLLRHIPLGPEQIHPMLPPSGSSETSSDEAPFSLSPASTRPASYGGEDVYSLLTLKEYASRYQDILRKKAGVPPVLDLAQLGIGLDGHTASLVPGDTETLSSRDAVAVSMKYQNRRRLTLTLPVLSAARNVLWLVTGPSKKRILERLQACDPELPACQVEQKRATLLYSLK